MRSSTIRLYLLIAVGLHGFRLNDTELFAAKAAKVTEEEEAEKADAVGRVQQALQIAKERNDRNLVKLAEELGREFQQRLPADADARLRALESQVGIDPGGWSMAGQPLFHGTPAMLERLKRLRPQLATAMKSDDPSQVRLATAAMLAVLGDQAGVPDGRRAGSRFEPRPITEAEATKLFLDSLAGEERTLRQLMDGKPLPQQMVRTYAQLLDAVTVIRPYTVRHLPARLADLDRLTFGLATLLTKLQQPSGHFPFPDLRGRNIRFGEMIERRVAAGQAEVRNGWVVSPDPDGGSQFDTGLCGVALLLANPPKGDESWRRAGLRAADWSLDQPCCANFNYNAFSVSLLAHAFRATADPKYLAGALRKFRVGIAPGQAPNGRWLDPHNARTVYHVIILRSLGDLSAVLPDNRAAERAELDQVTRPAIKTLLDEFEAMGITTEALPELTTLRNLYPADDRLRLATRQMIASIVAQCMAGERVQLGAQPQQLASVAPACSAFEPLP